MFVILMETAARLEELLADLTFGLLTWEESKPNDSIDFLDLTIFINKNSKIPTKSYKKGLNLHFYIPTASAYPKRMINEITFLLSNYTTKI